MTRVFITRLSRCFLYLLPHLVLLLILGCFVSESPNLSFPW